MKHYYILLIISCMIAAPLAAQTEKFDIASFIPPKGWQRSDSNGVLLFHDYQTQNNLISFCQLFIFPSRTSTGSAAKNFEDEWNNRIAKPTGSSVKPTTATEKSPDGWTVVTGSANITQLGVTYTCILVTVSGFGKVMSIVVNMAGQVHMAEVERFLNSFEVDTKANVATGNTANQSTLAGNFDWNTYSYITPENWYTQKLKDHVLLSQSQNVGQGCAITILSPQPSSGNLETDVKNVFNLMYPGWQYRQKGEKQYDLSKGYTLQGLEYYMMEAPMHKMRPDGYYYDYEDGAAMVIGLGKQIVIISGRHERLLACVCNHKYEYWRRFFNSFTVKNQPPSKNAQEDVSKRIIGDWMTMGGTALTEYIFAANGNYQFIGAWGSSSRVSGGAYHDYIEIKTSAWKGDGRYSIKGDQLNFWKHGDNKPEQVKFRFDKVNHGGTGWKDRLYMRKISIADGKEFEVRYEKQIR